MQQYIPTIQIRHKLAILYNVPIDGYKRRKNAIFTSMAKLQGTEKSNNNPFEGKKTYSGKITEGAKKRMVRAITLLLQSTPERYIINEVTGKRQKFKLSFITLTVSSKTKMLTAREAHKLLLEPMLLYLRRHHQMKLYVWKAELQKRGQIHYHITSDVFINHTHLRNKWNELQCKNGLLDDYYNDKGHYNANSTDVHSVYRLKDMASYLIKYMAKDGTKSPALQRYLSKYKEVLADTTRSHTTLPRNYFKHILQCTDGKIWDCAIALKSSKYFTTEADNTYNELINRLLIIGQISIVSLEFCTIIKFNNIEAKDILQKYDWPHWHDHIKTIRNFERLRPKRTINSLKNLPSIQPIKPVKPKQLILKFKRNDILQ